jgi:hypothetical protein
MFVFPVCFAGMQPTSLQHYRSHYQEDHSAALISPVLFPYDLSNGGKLHRLLF